MGEGLLKYFRLEARELSNELGQGVLSVEKGESGDGVARLLRAAHTLKGAARVVKQSRIAENAHAIETLLAPLRDAARPAEREEVAQLLRLVDEISTLLSALEPGADHPSVGSTGKEEPLGFARVDTAELDALLEGVLETGVHLRAVRSALDTLTQARRLVDILVDRVGASGLHDAERGETARSKTRETSSELRTLLRGMERRATVGLEQAERELLEVRDAAERLRLVPSSALFPTLERTVRDTAHALGREASFTGKGGDVRVDAHVLAQLQGALVQIMRNAVAHGMETPAERTTAGKPRIGSVELRVERRGNRVAWVCRDDGRGVDEAAVRRAAERAGLLTTVAAPLAGEELLTLLMKGGVSTSRVVTEMSGRGIGLDVVRETMDRLGGTVSLSTAARHGTTFELAVPVSLSALDALLVEADGATFAIPLDAVVRTMRLTRDDVVRTEEGDSIVHDGHAVPLTTLARTGTRSRRNAASALVIQGKDAMAAVSVGRLIGTTNVVVRPLPALALGDRMIAGVFLDVEGTPRLVLDPEGLVAAALGRRGAGVEPAPERHPKILIIDDSLTTRMLEQSILESAGYEVDLASSAEEGLEKAAQERYALFLVDVEMPGMDGFTFVERTRAAPELRGVPAILVSSRSAPEDLQRGKTAGAHAYVIKGEFDQARLLGTIQELLSP